MTIAEQGQPVTVDQLMDELGVKPEQAEVLLRIIDLRIAAAMRVAKDEILLKPEDVATILKVSPRTLETLIADGEIAYVRVGRQRRFNRSAIDAYYAANVERGTGRLRRAA